MEVKMNWHIILVGNEFAGNAGQIARTMGNFGFENLVLVDPLWDDPIQGFVYAHTPEGLEIFDKRKVFKTMDEAIDKLGLSTTIAFTRRSGKTRQINLNHREYFEKFFENLAFEQFSNTDTNIGLVFGREKTGLTSDEIEKCSVLVYIPTNPKSPSLNLAQAVAIILETIFYNTLKYDKDYLKKLNLITHEPSTQKERDDFYKEIIKAAKKRKLFIKNDEISFKRLFERIFSSPIISKKDLSLLKSMLMRFIFAEYIERTDKSIDDKNKNIIKNKEDG